MDKKMMYRQFNIMLVIVYLFDISLLFLGVPLFLFGLLVVCHAAVFRFAYVNMVRKEK